MSQFHKYESILGKTLPQLYQKTHACSYYNVVLLLKLPYQALKLIMEVLFEEEKESSTRVDSNYIQAQSGNKEKFYWVSANKLYTKWMNGECFNIENLGHIAWICKVIVVDILNK